jgi:hypothetical protein
LHFRLKSFCFNFLGFQSSLVFVLWYQLQKRALATAKSPKPLPGVDWDLHKYQDIAQKIMVNATFDRDSFVQLGKAELSCKSMLTLLRFLRGTELLKVAPDGGKQAFYDDIGVSPTLAKQMQRYARFCKQFPGAVALDISWTKFFSKAGGTTALANAIKSLPPAQQLVWLQRPSQLPASLFE